MKIKFVTKYLSIIIIFISFTLFPFFALAQEEVIMVDEDWQQGIANDSNLPTEPPVIKIQSESEYDDSQIRDRLKLHRQKLDDQYINEYENYLRLDEQYSLDKDQYFSLKTLKALELAVKSAKQAMKSRNRLLDLYMQILTVDLKLNKGISDQRRQLYLDRLATRRIELKESSVLIDDVVDRRKLNDYSDSFEPIGETIEYSCYGILSNLTLGRLQYSFSELVDYFNELKLMSEEKDIDDQEGWDHAINETELYITNTEILLDEFWEEINYSSNDKKSKYFYSNIISNTSNLYKRINKIWNYLNEIERYYEK